MAGTGNFLPNATPIAASCRTLAFIATSAQQARSARAASCLSASSDVATRNWRSTSGPLHSAIRSGNIGTRAERQEHACGGDCTSKPLLEVILQSWLGEGVLEKDQGKICCFAFRDPLQEQRNQCGKAGSRLRGRLYFSTCRRGNRSTMLLKEKDS